MTPAALKAASDGDMENFIVASTPGGIEAQEKRGQLEQARKQTLPILCPREEFEALGFVFGRNVDELFVEATFPAGWKKAPTEHSMWSDIVDGKGRKRGSIFYKAAFYDRSAHAHLERRFAVSSDYGDAHETVYIRDACGVVERRGEPLPRPHWSDRAQARAAYEKIEAAQKEMADWLTQNYPDWESPMALWD